MTAHIPGRAELLHPLPPERVETLPRERERLFARHSGDEHRVRGEQAEPGIGFVVVVGKRIGVDLIGNRRTVGRIETRVAGVRGRRIGVKRLDVIGCKG